MGLENAFGQVIEYYSRRSTPEPANGNLETKPRASQWPSNSRGNSIRSVSKKRARLNRQRAQATKAAREVDNTCHIKSPVCTGYFDAFHEVIKCSANGAIVPGSEKAKAQGQVFIRSCNPCNGYIEDNVAWAKENGYAKSRFEQDNHAD